MGQLSSHGTPVSSEATPDEQQDSTTALAAYAARLDFSDIPVAVVDHAKLSILDTVGCGLFGSTLPWSGILRDTIAAIDGVGTCAIWGQQERASPVHAALVNGTAVHGFELDDLHPRSIVHVGSVVLPAALAVGETVDGSAGRQLITAVVAGYEVVARLGMSVGAAHLLQGWHPTATHGTVGAAVAAGVMLGLDVDQMANALGIAATQASGLMAAQYGAMVKRLHAGRAAQSGVYAALLAARGFTGIANVFEAEYGGYCRTLSPTYHAPALTVGLGQTWQTLQVGFKPYPTNGSCHPTIDALLEMTAADEFSPDQVAEVRIRVSTATKQHVGWAFVPTSVTAAQMNLSYIAAVVICDRAATVAQFTEERLTDPVVLGLASRVHVEADPEIDAEGDAARHATRLEVRLLDGRLLRTERRHAKGSSHDPLSAAEITTKFEQLAATAVPTGRAQRLRSLVAALEEITVAELAGELAA